MKSEQATAIDAAIIETLSEGLVMEPVQDSGVSTDEFDLDRIDSLPTFDPADHLRSEAAIAAFINDFLQDGDPALIVQALGIAARAKGMTELSKETGIAREALYKALRQESLPRFDTILRVMKALGLRLVVEPIQEPAATPGE